jgi:gamma-D-glutamyl-L-lysine dipeptidyl-peptidase
MVIDYGVCRLAVVQIFPAPSPAEQISQLLFGEHYTVSAQSRDQRWLQINVNDSTTGWIDKLQHHSISAEYFNQINTADFKITTDVTSTILFKKNQITIVMGSIVPISGSELFKMEEQFAFNGETKSLGQRRDIEYLKSTAFKYLNAPHQRGGRSPFGIDSAGLVHMVFKISGYPIPRTVDLQYASGKKIKEQRAGDLAFFKGKDGKVNHVGILVDDERIIHCSGKVRLDHLTDNGILSSEAKLVTHELAGVRRFLP